MLIKGKWSKKVQAFSEQFWYYMDYWPSDKGYKACEYSHAKFKKQKTNDKSCMRVQC